MIVVSVANMQCLQLVLLGIAAAYVCATINDLSKPANKNPPEWKAKPEPMVGLAAKSPSMIPLVLNGTGSVLRDRSDPICRTEACVARCNYL